MKGSPDDVCLLVFQALASAIAATEVMTAQQVVKAENGEEVRSPAKLQFPISVVTVGAYQNVC